MFCLGTRGLFEELGRHIGGGGSQECCTHWASRKSIEQLFLSVCHTIPRDNSSGLLEKSSFRHI